MKPFRIHRPATVEDAILLMSRTPSAACLAGGTNLVDLMKLEVMTPEHLIDIGNLIPSTITLASDGSLTVGGAATNADLAAHPAVRERFPCLAQALLSGASPQIRNKATAAGNLLQRTRCVYFTQLASPCNKRVSGSGCSAISGRHRNHAILGASDLCIATHPSDFAVALAAHDARCHVIGTRGHRTIDCESLHNLPTSDPGRDSVLEPDELIVEIEIPQPPPGARVGYRKVRDRRSFAFALVSVAAVLKLDQDTVTGIAIALGGVAAKPWRARRAESALIGQPASREAFAAALDNELAQASPLAENAFKVRLAHNTAVALLTELSAR